MANKELVRIPFVKEINAKKLFEEIKESIPSLKKAGIRIEPDTSDKAKKRKFLTIDTLNIPVDQIKEILEKHMSGPDVTFPLRPPEKKTAAEPEPTSANTSSELYASEEEVLRLAKIGARIPAGLQVAEAALMVMAKADELIKLNADNVLVHVASLEDGQRRTEDVLKKLLDGQAETIARLAAVEAKAEANGEKSQINDGALKKMRADLDAHKNDTSKTDSLDQEIKKITTDMQKVKSDVARIPEKTGEMIGDAMGEIMILKRMFAFFQEGVKDGVEKAEKAKQEEEKKKG